jgi:hypothetical protein
MRDGTAEASLTVACAWPPLYCSRGHTYTGGVERTKHDDELASVTTQGNTTARLRLPHTYTSARATAAAAAQI